MLAALEVHPRLSQLGLSMDWTTPAGKKPVLVATVEAIARCPSIDRIAVIVPAELPGFAGEVTGALSRAEVPGARLFAFAARGREDYPLAELRRHRRLTPAAWRGGWALPYAIAERGDPHRWLELCEQREANDVMLFPAAAPLVDPSLVEESIAAHREQESARLRLATLPPGALGDIVSRSFLRDVVERGIPVDAALRFEPGRAERDLDTKGVFHWFSEPRARLRHRLTVDSPREQAIVETLLAAGASLDRAPGEPGWIEALCDAPDVGRWLAGPVPRKVRLELTRRRRRESAFDLPLEGRFDGQEEMSLDLVGKVLDELEPWGDVQVVLAGGEPTLHSQFDAVLDRLVGSRPGSVVVETDGQELAEGTLGRLESSVDGLIIPLDAVETSTYASLRGGDLRVAEASVRRLAERFQENGGPFVAVEMRLCEANHQESEAFIDRWFESTPWVLLSPFSHRAGQLDHESLHPYRLPERSPCVRLEEELVIAADGRAAICQNDFRGLAPAGDARSDTLQSIWTGDALAGLRASHAAGDWSAHPLCACCEDWCRRA